MVKNSIRIVLLLVLFVQHNAFTQDKANSIFWEVTGNGLEKSSYIFGTFHLLKSNYVDSFAVIKQKLRTCKTVVGELQMSDTTGMSQFMASTKLQGTTLQQLYDSTTYKAMNDSMLKWIKVGLKSFNTSKPMYIQAIVMQMAFPKVFPEIAKGKGALMDMYFQQLGRENNMQVAGLETIAEQSELLFTFIPIERQLAMLKEMLLNPDKEKELKMLMNMYLNQDITEIEQLMNKDMQPDEVAMLVDNRNKSWIPKLENMMKAQPTFVAVGAAHLAGVNGVVALLRAKGYTVTPVALH